MSIDTIATTFNCTTTDVMFYNLHKYLGIPKGVDIETNQFPCYIEYELQPEVREWGVKSITCVIKSVKTMLEWYVYDSKPNPVLFGYKLLELGINCQHNQRKDAVMGTIEIDTNGFYNFNGKTWAIESDLSFEEDGGFSMSSVEIDFDKMIITVS